jgi:hypothetical protein
MGWQTAAVMIDTVFDIYCYHCWKENYFPNRHTANNIASTDSGNKKVQLIWENVFSFKEPSLGSKAGTNLTKVVEGA